jgi:hypothetical protein
MDVHHVRFPASEFGGDEAVVAEEQRWHDAEIIDQTFSDSERGFIRFIGFAPAAAAASMRRSNPGLS